MLVRALRGAPWTVLIAMIMLPGPHGVTTLMQSTGYSDKTISKALDDLEALGFVQSHGRYVAYILTAQARQLLLFDGDALAAEDEVEAEVIEAETENFRLDHATEPGRRKISVSRSSSSTPCSSCSEQSPKTTTTPQSETENFRLPLDPDVDAALELLEGVGVPQAKAQTAIQTALAHGWDGAQCAECISGWLAYCETDAGSTVKHPGFLAAARLKSRRNAPTVEPRKMTTQDYIQAAYDRLVKS
jgi:DNA-binding HxlR family transcriptional regulator